MWSEFPKDPNTFAEQEQFMLGEYDSIYHVDEIRMQLYLEGNYSSM